MKEGREAWQQHPQADMHATLMRCFVQLLREQRAQRAQLAQRGLKQALRLPFTASMPCCRYRLLAVFEQVSHSSLSGFHLCCVFWGQSWSRRHPCGYGDLYSSVNALAYAPASTVFGCNTSLEVLPKSTWPKLLSGDLLHGVTLCTGCSREQD